MTLTVKQVIELMQSDEIIENSVDLLEFGDPDMAVRGIATAFKATQETIEEAVRLGANLLITHESVFYTHRENPEQPLGGTVMQEKRRFIDDKGIAIYRNHDHIHRYRPDGIMRGLLQRLEWEERVSEELAYAAIVELPETFRLQDAVSHVKKQLGIEYVRVVGDLNKICRRAGILVGYRGGGSLAIPFMEEHRLDLLIIGEGQEWETPEYVRDAARLGHDKALLALGHAESEDAGMEWLASRLRKQLKDLTGNGEPGIPVHFIPAKPLFRFY